MASADQTAALSCRVTAQNSAGATSATSNALTVPPTGPPYATVAPSIGGTGVVGQTVTCSTGTWVGLAPITYAFQWLRNGVAISGATKSSYLVTSADLLTALGCRVTATNSKGAVSATSTIGVPQSGVPADIVAPLVSGTPVVGQKSDRLERHLGGRPAADLQPSVVAQRRGDQRRHRGLLHRHQRRPAQDAHLQGDGQEQPGLGRRLKRGRRGRAAAHPQGLGLEP